MLTLPRVYPILDTGKLTIPIPEAAEGLVEGGAKILQFRHKGFFGRDAYRDATMVAALCRSIGVTFVINDRADIALLLDTDLHLGQDDLEPAEARKLRPTSLLGLSTHNESQFIAAQLEPCDYTALGPIFGTASKANPDPVVGLTELARLRPLSQRPVVAIGGITRDNASHVWSAGADSVAVVGDLYPESASKQSIRNRMEEWMKIANE